MTDFWESVDTVWRECFRLAWESFQLGSIPVGAVFVDPGGTVIARGRNRWAENSAPDGQIAGSNVAHAEINVLATLPPGDYAEHLLYTTLEPCFLCTAALRHSHVGAVRFAAPDPVWTGIERLPELNPNMARHWPRRDGPLGGPLQNLSVFLHLVSAMERGVRSVVESHEEAMPELVRMARGVTADDLRSTSLVEALALACSDS